MTSGDPRGQRELTSLWTASIDDYPTAVTYTPDGTLCAVGTSGGELVVVDSATGKVQWRAPAHPGGLLGVTASDRLFATCGQDGRALLFDHHGVVRAELPGAAPWVEHVAFSPDGRRLATASGKLVRVWNDDGSPDRESPAHPSTVTAMCWSRSGASLASTCYGGAYLWDVKGEAAARHLPFKGSLISVAWSPDERVIACGSQDCSVHFWRLPHGKDSEMTGYPFKPKALAWDARSSLLATGGDASICLWDFAGRGPEGTAPIVLESHLGQVTALAFHPRSAVLVSCAQDMGLIVWEPRRSRQPIGFCFVDDTLEALVWNPDGRTFVTADASGALHAWQPPTASA